MTGGTDLPNAGQSLLIPEAVIDIIVEDRVGAHPENDPQCLGSIDTDIHTVIRTEEITRDIELRHLKLEAILIVIVIIKLTHIAVIRDTHLIHLVSVPGQGH